jgi:hypothetical protein
VVPVVERSEGKGSEWVKVVEGREKRRGQLGEGEESA